MDSKPSGKQVDWGFLIFLIGLTYVKLYVKIIAIVVYFLVLLGRKYTFTKMNRLNGFYFLICIAGLVSSFLNGSFYEHGYTLGFVTGIVQWLVAGVGSYFIYITAVNDKADSMYHAIRYLFIINFAVSLINLGLVVVEAGHPVPYWLTSSLKFGVSTGDYINGVFGSSSVNSAAISALGVIYFLFRRSFKMAMICLFTVALCTSNVTFGFLVLVLLVVMLFADRVYRKNSIIMMAILVAMYWVLSPVNFKYIDVVYSRGAEDDVSIGREQVSSDYKAYTETVEEEKSDIIEIYRNKDEYKKDNLNDIISGARIDFNYRTPKTPVLPFIFYYNNIDKYRIPTNPRNYIDPAQELKILKEIGEKDQPDYATTKLNPKTVEAAMARWYAVPQAKSPLAKYSSPGKVYAYTQTGFYAISGWRNLIFGAGVGNFSSKLAIKKSGIGVQGDFPESSTHVARPFLQYHMYTLLYYLSLHASEHSIINMPYSAVSQLQGEYGLVGMIIFIVCYVGFVWRRRKTVPMLPYLVLLLFMFLAVEYWFEMITLTVVFEAMAFQEIYRKKLVDE